MDAQLKILSGPLAGGVIPVTKSRYVIGREPDCDCRLNDLSISRHHCVLILDDKGLRIRDLGSKNGTLVNRSQIGGKEIVLADGDLLRVGSSIARIELGSKSTLSEKRGLTTKFFVRDETAIDASAPRPAELDGRG